MKVAEAAKILGVGEQRVRNLIYGGRLKSEKNEHGHHDIDPASLEALTNRSIQSLPTAKRLEQLEERVEALDTLSLIHISEPTRPY